MHFVPRITLPALLVLALVPLSRLTASAAPSAGRAAVWLNDTAPDGPAFAREIGASIQRAGWSLEYLDSLALSDVTQLSADRFGLLVLPGARRLPLESVGSIQAYLKRGGDLLVLGLPAWETPVFRRGDRWMTRAEYVAALNAQTPAQLLLEFKTDGGTPQDASSAPTAEARATPVNSTELARWHRHAHRPGVPSVREVVQDERGGALHVVLEGLDGWDTLEPPTRVWAFPRGQTLTCFRAKGSARTRQLALEWVEQDGSRWIATVDLTSEWRRFALPPEAFKPWLPTSGRGGAGDRVNLGRLARFTLGLAQTHTSVETGKQEYWFADLGMAPNPFGDAPLAELPLPRLESVAPDYMVFPVSTPAVVAPPQGQALLPLTHLPSADSDRRFANGATPAVDQPMRALHPRPRGVGFNQDRSFRWQPILVARDRESDDYRGAVAAVVAHFQPPFRGGVWALFTPDDPAFYRHPTATAWIEQAARRLRLPLYFQEGGSEFFTVFPDQLVTLGARLANFSDHAVTNLEVRLSVCERGVGRLVHDHRVTVSLGPGQAGTVTNIWTPDAWPDQGCVVAARVVLGGQVLDELSHELNCWEPRTAPAYLAARDGGLWLAGRPWKAHGINYMPSSGIGIASEYFEFWLGRGAYDPEVIERDLRHIQSVGLNAISAFVYHRDLGAQHLLDLLFRCERLGLKVNLSLRPGTPMDFRWNEMKALIEHYRLAQNDTVIAYDLAWEPSHYDQRYQQRQYTRAWNDWVQRRYGSATAAAKAWKETEALPSQPVAGDGQAPELLVPPMSQLVQDGPWRGCVADYRAFLDDMLAARYAEARRLVRTIDPHHLISFRMQHAGDPTHNAEGMLPYDFYGLRDAVDVWEPEAYGRIGDWPQVSPGLFTAAYARLCDSAKPLIWAEMGYNVWDPSRRAPAPSKLEFAARFYRDFYRLLRESGADGVFCWWYPGGFRLNENSDFGLFNPDGTDRPATRVIREEGPGFLAAPKPPPPTHWMGVDRDRDARGLFGIYEAAKAEYWRLLQNGDQPGLRWQRAPGAR